MENKQAGFIVPLLIAIAAIVLIGGGVYAYIYDTSRSPGDHNLVSGTGTISTEASTTKDTITEDTAIEIVSNLPDVKKWEESFTGPNGTSPTTGGTPAFTIDSETDTTYVVHVYEDMPDHTATFGWYDVDKTTGAVSSESM